MFFLFLLSSFFLHFLLSQPLSFLPLPLVFLLPFISSFYVSSCRISFIFPCFLLWQLCIFPSVSLSFSPTPWFSCHLLLLISSFLISYFFIYSSLSPPLFPIFLPLSYSLGFLYPTFFLHLSPTFLFLSLSSLVFPSLLPFFLLFTPYFSCHLLHCLPFVS